jgi:hypothetical protein
MLMLSPKAISIKILLVLKNLLFLRTFLTLIIFWLSIKLFNRLKIRILLSNLILLILLDLIYFVKFYVLLVVIFFTLLISCILSAAFADSKCRVFILLRFLIMFGEYRFCFYLWWWTLFKLIRLFGFIISKVFFMWFNRICFGWKHFMSSLQIKFFRSC